MDIESIKQLVERTGWVPKGRPFKIEILGGGITNENYRIEFDSRAYVVRVAGKNTSLLGINRQNELHNQRVAARMGIAPEIIAFREEECVFLTQFVEGRKGTPEQLCTPEILQAVADHLRLLHNGPEFLGTFSPFTTIDSYARIASEHGVAPPQDLTSVHHLKSEIHRALLGARAFERRPVHADLLNENFVLSPTKVWILDWEYAGMGDLYFDLANFADHNDFTQDHEVRLLEKYFGQCTEGDHARLKLMRMMSNAREAMWGVAQTALSTLDFDFTGYARRFAHGLMVQAADAHYPRWLMKAAEA